MEKARNVSENGIHAITILRVSRNAMKYHHRHKHSALSLGHRYNNSKKKIIVIILPAC